MKVSPRFRKIMTIILIIIMIIIICNMQSMIIMIIVITSMIIIMTIPIMIIILLSSLIRVSALPSICSLCNSVRYLPHRTSIRNVASEALHYMYVYVFYRRYGTFNLLLASEACYVYVCYRSYDIQ